MFNAANMSFNTIRENKILAKISEFTVADCILFLYHVNHYPANIVLGQTVPSVIMCDTFILIHSRLILS